MSGRTIKAALQYSKWLSKFICWIWALYRFSVLVAASLVPQAADAIASTLGTLDTIMLVNEGTYLINSLGEKYIFSDRFVLTAFNKGWFKSFFKGVKTVVEDDEIETAQLEEDNEAALEDEAQIEEAVELEEAVEDESGEGNG